jgi:hypothetical protein
MRAREYANRYIAEGRTSEALYKVWRDIFIEFQDLVKARHASTDAAAIAIVKELNQKWKTFARLAGPEVKPDGFMELIRKKFPELYTTMTLVEKVQ